MFNKKQKRRHIKVLKTRWINNRPKKQRRTTTTPLNNVFINI